MASVAFSPIAPLVASIGPSEATAASFDIPVGPLRILDATTGKARTLLGGTVISDWWSPDGRTIAAIVVQPVGSGSPSAPGASAAAGSAAPSLSASRLPAAGSAEPGASPAPSASPASQEVRVVFVDAASGAIQADAVVEPGRLFVDQYLTYFDQYATSHQLWAPDSSSILIPVDDATGSHLRLVPRAGGTAKELDGVMGAWSP
jgi:TolB protein